MVHGFMGGSAQWAGQSAALGQEGEMITVDLPGFGDNSHLPALGSIGGYADWVIATLRDQGVTRYHLLGHSMGGMVAQEIAGRDAAHVERMILYATGAVGVLPGRFETIDQSKARTVAQGAKATARRIAATWFVEREAAAGYEACAQIAQQARVEAMLAGLDAMAAWDGAAALPALLAKTLVLWGDRDRTYAWAQPHQLWSDLPNASLAVVPGCAHAVHLEKPALFNALVRDFLTVPTDHK